QCIGQTPHKSPRTRRATAAFHSHAYVVYPTSAKHRAGDTGIDRKCRRKFADFLRPRDDDFVFKNKFFKLIEKARETIDNLLCLFHPTRRRVASATPETHVVAHHP